LGLFPLGKCRKSGNHPKEDLVESGLETKYEVWFFNHPFTFWLHTANQSNEIWQILVFVSSL
jgi:hypothetical protein